MKRVASLLLFLATLLTSASTTLQAGEGPDVQRIHIVHFSHQDVGFTDMPGVCRELQQRYLDCAIDAILASMTGPDEGKFYWTVESLLVVDDWWRNASEPRRQDLLRAVSSGQLDIAALPMNQAPFLNAAQWKTMLHWIPDDLWKQLNPTVALQDDVNGCPRAGALGLLDRGVKNLFMSINGDSGGPPLYRPSAFWWKMPDGRRLLVWLNYSYPDGYDFFETAHWRRGPVPQAADATFRPPRSGDFFRTDEASLRAAHAQCTRRLVQLKREGYAYSELIISMTNHWRMDNDPPFLPLANFIAAWNKLGLRPELRFTTVSKAMAAMEPLVSKAPEYEGEFTDWWANGTASAPRETSASRLAKFNLEAAQSPLWGPLEERVVRKIDSLYKDLCLFDEHTWGSSMSVALPWNLDTQGQFAEKAMFAYRPKAQSEWLLAQRARTRLLREGDGLFVANTSAEPFSGWVYLNTSCLRGSFKSLRPANGGDPIALQFLPGIQPWGRPHKPTDLTRENTAAVFPDNVPNLAARFWVENLAPQSFLRLRPEAQTAEDRAPAGAPPEVALDPDGWPTSAKWPKMTKPLFTEGIGNFTAVKVNAFSARWTLSDLANSRGPRNETLRKEKIEQTQATADGKAALVETPHSLQYTQWLSHPRLKYAVRSLELWKHQPRARLTLKLYRLSSDDPEAFFATFPLPCENVLPTLSSGGVKFTPYKDQIPGTCRDHFAIDGWAHYATPDGHWVWSTRDAPLMTFGAPHIWERLTAPPAGTNRVLSMFFNNFWYTNFVGDQHGAMEFQFDLAWRADLPDAASLGNALSAQPFVLLNDASQESPIFMDRLHKP
ncbi:MAG TPA: hypothetical protein VGP72_15255 [Planctomycetota bacterium]|jgi:hypothetical protein